MTFKKIGNDKQVFSWEELIKNSIKKFNKNIKMKVSEYSKFIEDSNEDLGKAVSKSSKENKSIVIKVQVSEFIDRLKKYNDITFESLFEHNVRGNVTSNKKTFKKGFEHTITNEPHHFDVFNNGITIICDHFEGSHSNVVEMINPQIVNGQQTTRTLMNLSEESNLSKTYIYLKIIQTENDDLIMNIAKYSNTQSAIKHGDLISTTKEFQKLNNECIEAGYYLVSKEGKSLQGHLYKTMKMKRIKMNDLIKYYIAIKDHTRMGKAKSNIGLIKSEMIREAKFSEIDIQWIKNAFKAIKKKYEFVKFGKEKVFQEIDDENQRKQKNKIWSFAEMAIYRMQYEQMSSEKIYQKLSRYRDEYKGDSLIQPFKINEAYLD